MREAYRIGCIAGVRLWEGGESTDECGSVSMGNLDEGWKCEILRRLPPLDNPALMILGKIRQGVMGKKASEGEERK